MLRSPLKPESTKGILYSKHHVGQFGPQRLRPCTNRDSIRAAAHRPAVLISGGELCTPADAQVSAPQTHSREDVGIRSEEPCAGNGSQVGMICSADPIGSTPSIGIAPPGTRFVPLLGSIGGKGGCQSQGGESLSSPALWAPPPHHPPAPTWHPPAPPSPPRMPQSPLPRKCWRPPFPVQSAVRISRQASSHGMTQVHVCKLPHLGGNLDGHPGPPVGGGDARVSNRVIIVVRECTIPSAVIGGVLDLEMVTMRRPVHGLFV